MPGTPGTLSEVSPISARASQTSSGPTPNFSITSARPIAFCFIGSHIATPSATSCIRSLSEETTVTSSPAARAVLGVGGDQVVGLVALDVDHRQAEGAGGLADQRELRDELLRRLVAVGLVLVVELLRKLSPL